MKFERIQLFFSCVIFIRNYIIYHIRFTVDV